MEEREREVWIGEAQGERERESNSFFGKAHTHNV